MPWPSIFLHPVFSPKAEADRRRFRWAVPLLASIGVGVALGTVPSMAQEPEKAINSEQADVRLGPLRTLDDYFPMRPVELADAWEDRKAEIRRRVLVANGLWPQPTKTPLNARIHTPVEREDFTVHRVILESFPGHYVTGSLFRPKDHIPNRDSEGRRPAVLSPHGHWQDGRFYRASEEDVRQQIAIGGERFVNEGRYPIQARCVQLARMGCVVFQYDMVGYADSVQLGHRPGLREEMTGENWGFFSPTAELHLINMMGLQTWNSVRALDFLAGLSDVDPQRIAVTGASGGGTQTMMLAAIDDRVAVSVPAVMVSTAMQGGCTCENATYLRINSGNIDIAAAHAPKPLGMTAADDWTVELETKGYPDLVKLYEMLGHEDDLSAAFHLQFGHNYNAVNRSYMYGVLNEHLHLGFDEPIIETHFKPLSREELTVWTDEYKQFLEGNRGDDPERRLVRWWAEDAQNNCDVDCSRNGWETILAKRLEELREVNSGWALAGDLSLRIGGVSFGSGLHVEEGERDYVQTTARLSTPSAKEWVTIQQVVPEESPKWNGDAVLLLGHAGISSFWNGIQPIEQVDDLLQQGFAVVAVDLLGQGNGTENGQPWQHARLHTSGDQPWQQAAAYTFGYNHPLFVQRVHDTLTAIKYATQQKGIEKVHLVGLGREAGSVAVAARFAAGDAVASTVVFTDGFEFETAKLLDDTMFVPGALRYGGLEALARLGKGNLKTIEEAQSFTDAAQQAVEHLTAD